MDSLLSNYQCEFRKGLSTQNCLWAILKNGNHRCIKGKHLGNY